VGGQLGSSHHPVLTGKSQSLPAISREVSRMDLVALVYKQESEEKPIKTGSRLLTVSAVGPT